MDRTDDLLAYFVYVYPQINVPTAYLERKLMCIYRESMAASIEKAVEDGYLLKIDDCLRLTDSGRQRGTEFLQQKRPRICTYDARRAHQKVVDAFSDELWTRACEAAREDFSDVLETHVFSAAKLLCSKLTL